MFYRMAKIDEQLFCVTMIQVILEHLVRNGVITGDDQRAMYLEAAEVIAKQGDRRDADTITYLKYLAYGSDAESDKLE